MPDITLSVTVPDAQVQRVMDAINGRADIDIKLTTDGSPGFTFSYEAKQGGESNLQYGERFVKELIRGLVREYELNVDTLRYETDINAVSQPTQNVPDGIVT